MKKGQVLLITVMLLATVMTVVLSVAFQGTTETQTTKLEEENQKALAAAEAAIEASIKSGASTDLASLSIFAGSGFTGGATVSQTSSNTFTSPTVANNSAYTFYLGNYHPADKTLDNNTDIEGVTVCFSTATPDPAIEITLLKTSGVKKYVVDPHHDLPGRIIHATPSTDGCGTNSNFQYSFPIPATDISSDTKLIMVRLLFNSSKLYFSRSNDFSLQGKTITSEAKSAAGVSKEVVLFQSYPQIPAEFFNTSF